MAWSKDVFFMSSRLDIINLTTVEGAIYGFIFALYIHCARSLYFQLEDQDQRRQRLFTLVYMSFIMALALFNLAVDAYDKQTSYVDHGDYPDGGGYSYSLNVFGGSPLATMDLVSCNLVGLMTSAIQIWRLWVVWKPVQYSLFIVMFPVLFLLGYIGFQTVAVVIQAQDLSMYRLLAIAYDGIMGFPLCISVIVTILITGRIFMVRRKHIEIMGQTDGSSPYTSITSMLIESFALESVWMIGGMSGRFSPSSVTQVLASNFFENTQPVIQILAYLLVVHRVTMKWGWEKDTSEKLTPLEWHRNVSQTTQISTRETISITVEEV